MNQQPLYRYIFYSYFYYCKFFLRKHLVAILILSCTLRYTFLNKWSCVMSDDYVQKINELCRANKHKEALQDVNKMIEQNPDYSLAYMHKGWLLCDYLGNPDEGYIYYDIYSSMEEDNTPASFEHDYQHGQMLFGANEKFIEISNNVLADSSSDPEQIYHAHNQKALNFASLGKFDEAIKAIDEAILKYPNDYTVHSNKGEIFYRCGKYDEAIVWLDKAIAIDPVFHLAYKYKGLSLYALEKFEEAVVAYNKSLADEIYEDVQRDRRRALRKLNTQRNLTIGERHYYQLVLGILDENDIDKSALDKTKTIFNISEARTVEIKSMVKDDIKIKI